MKKTILLLMAAVCCMAASAEAPQRKMLEQSKTWVYVYHHFEEREDHTDYDHTMWLMNYVLEGDTVIDNRQYMKMYRHDERNWNDKKYYAAFREDEEGRVYVYYKNSNDEFKLIDFSFDYEEVEASQPAILSETIKVNGQLFHRYRYQQTIGGTTYDTESGVEGVGFEGKGLVHYLFEAVPDCICDYEEFSYVYGSGFWFSASDFAAPKEIELTEDERNLVAGNNDFAFNLFRKARDEKSCILSPLSITYALGMLNNGAAGLTQQEINQTLGFGDAGAEAINDFCLKMLTESNTLVLLQFS